MPGIPDHLVDRVIEYVCRHRLTPSFKGCLFTVRSPARRSGPSSESVLRVVVLIRVCTDTEWLSAYMHGHAGRP